MNSQNASVDHYLNSMLACLPVHCRLCRQEISSWFDCTIFPVLGEAFEALDRFQYDRDGKLLSRSEFAHKYALSRGRIGADDNAEKPFHRACWHSLASHAAVEEACVQSLAFVKGFSCGNFVKFETSEVNQSPLHKSLKVRDSIYLSCYADYITVIIPTVVKLEIPRDPEPCSFVLTRQMYLALKHAVEGSLANTEKTDFDIQIRTEKHSGEMRYGVERLLIRSFEDQLALIGYTSMRRFIVFLRHSTLKCLLRFDPDC